MDDVDYYPDAYLNRLAHEGVNGLWLSIEWKDITKTSFRAPSPDLERRLAKLRRTVEKCARYGIKIWLYSNEPEGFYSADDPMLRAHPELAGAGWGPDASSARTRSRAAVYLRIHALDFLAGEGARRSDQHLARRTRLLLSRRGRRGGGPSSGLSALFARAELANACGRSRRDGAGR
jgi:hypothetical protein